MSMMMRPEKRSWGPSVGVPPEMAHGDVINALGALARAAGVRMDDDEIEDATRVTIHDWPTFRDWILDHQQEAFAAVAEELVGFADVSSASDLVVAITEQTKAWSAYVDPDDPKRIEILVDQ